MVAVVVVIVMLVAIVIVVVVTVAVAAELDAVAPVCSVNKKKQSYFLGWHLQTIKKRCNYWQNDSVRNGDPGRDYVFHLACVMPVSGKTFQTSYNII